MTTPRHDPGFAIDPATDEVTARQHVVAEHPLDDHGDGDDVEPEPLPISPRRRRVSWVTATLALAAVAAAGFYAGVLVQKHQKSSASSTASALQALASRFGAGGRNAAAGGLGGGGFGAGGGAGRVSGTVKLVDGTNIYVTDAQGNTVKVATGSGAQFTKPAAGSLTDVKIGDRVTVQGPQGADGTYQAQQVTIGGAGGGGAGRGFGGGGAGGGGSGGGRNGANAATGG